MTGVSRPHRCKTCTRAYNGKRWWRWWSPVLPHACTVPTVCECDRSDCMVSRTKWRLTYESWTVLTGGGTPEPVTVESPQWQLVPANEDCYCFGSTVGHGWDPHNEWDPCPDGGPVPEGGK